MQPKEAQTFHVIFVDDEEELAEILAISFEEEVESGSIKASYFIRAKDCVDFLEKHPLERGKALIISDINMPGMNGIEMLDLIKQKYPEVPGFYVMSAYNTEEYIRRVGEVGAIRFFDKPLTIAKLKAAIAEDFGISLS